MSCRQARGFTLVELVTIIVVIAVLAAVAVPRMIGRQGFEARGFYDAAAAAIRYAQKTAVAARRSVYVVVGASVVSVCFDAACANPVTDPATGGALKVDATRGISGLSAPAAVSPAGSFSFDALGQPSFTSTLTLTFAPAEAGDVTRHLVIEAGTGYVHGS